VSRIILFFIVGFILGAIFIYFRKQKSKEDKDIVYSAENNSRAKALGLNFKVSYPSDYLVREDAREVSTIVLFESATLKDGKNVFSVSAIEKPPNIDSKDSRGLERYNSRKDERIFEKIENIRSYHNMFKGFPSFDSITRRSVRLTDVQSNYLEYRRDIIVGEETVVYLKCGHFDFPGLDPVPVDTEEFGLLIYGVFMPFLDSLDILTFK
jgi:hypothetical protein